MCNQGYYELSGGSFVCELCNDPCTDCVTDPDTCTVCFQNNAGDTVYLHDSQCIEDCPEHFYGMVGVENNLCFSCHGTCLTCSGNYLNECLSCEYGVYLYETQADKKYCIA